ncbi:MAG: hypothetical protein JXR42_01770 [Gammaproteobacteria bacterium]|nr:hypothetical protein [Gammaproteobacteria bacterium]
MSIKKILATITIIITTTLSFSCFAWWSTGHEMIAQIAYDNLTPNTKIQVAALLEKSLNWPNVAPSKLLPPPAKLSEKLNNMVLASTWPDALKNYTWQGANGAALQQAYSNLHFVDTPFGAKARENCALINWHKRVKQTMQDSNGDNVVSGIQSSIKTLESTESVAQKAIALRYLIHLIGDVHMPFHSSDPVFTLKGSVSFKTYGANGITFDPSDKVFIYNYYHPDISLVSIDNLHELWDGAINAYRNIPDPYNSTYNTSAENDWQKYGSSYKNYIEKEALAIQKTLAANYRIQKLISSRPNPIFWATNSAKTACMLVNNKQQISFAPYKTQKNGQTIYGATIKFKNGIANYEERNSYIAKRQIYLAGMRLANILNAIFAPNKDNNQRYTNYIKRITANNNIQPLDQLVDSQI